MLNKQVVTIADVPPADPRVSSEYINKKYKDWLRRRGLTDPAYAAELEAMEKRSQINFKKAKRR